MKNGFILVPDMKWDGKQLEDLYVVALVQDRSLHSIRSLTAEHIPLLENIQKKGLVCIVTAGYTADESDCISFVFVIVFCFSS